MPKEDFGAADEAENVKRDGGIAHTGELARNEEKPKEGKVAMRGFAPGISIDQEKGWTEEFLSPQLGTLQNGKLYGQMIFLRMDRNHYFVLLEIVLLNCTSVYKEEGQKNFDFRKPKCGYNLLDFCPQHWYSVLLKGG